MLPFIIGFPASSDEFVESKQLDHERTINFLLFAKRFYSYFIKALKQLSIRFTGVINHLGHWRKKLVNYEPLGE